MADTDDIRAQLARLGDERAALRAAERQTTAELRTAVVEAGQLGVTTAEIVRLSGVDRMTVLVWLGKRQAK